MRGGSRGAVAPTIALRKQTHNDEVEAVGEEGDEHAGSSLDAEGKGSVCNVEPFADTPNAGDDAPSDFRRPRNCELTPSR